jgi:16S rRNA (uracil1498-N3)-methyltransferase
MSKYPISSNTPINIARFYVNISLISGQAVTLPLEVYHHIQARRIRVGQQIILFNNTRHSYLATIVSLTRKITIAQIGLRNSDIIHNDQNYTASMPWLNLETCIISNDRMDLIIQKATELNIEQITPILSTYSSHIPLDKITQRLEHWKKISISACEQCGRNLLPKINQPINLKSLVENKLEQKKLKDLRLILIPDSKIYDNNIVKTSLSILPKKSPPLINVLIGPEGGFAQKEIELAISANYLPIQLGQNILRTETAAISIIAALNTKYRW